MSYERQNFTDGQKLKAEHLNKMDEALANPPIVVAKFESTDDGLSYCSTTHTAEQIWNLLATGTAVIAHLNNIESEYFFTMMCWQRDGAICVGEPIADSGWSHFVGFPDYYIDGDSSNKTIGNERWNEF